MPDVDLRDSIITSFSPAGGGYTASSHGTAQVSGINASGDMGSSAYSGMMVSGVFFVETQTLDIDYARVPHATVQGHGHALTLSGYSASGGVGGTDLTVLVQAGYKVEKVTGQFYTSSFLQTQKFEIQAASADINGNTYGPSAPTASALGPAGKIITTQKWYNRRPWNDGGDSVMTCSVFGCNRAYASSGTTIWQGFAGATWQSHPQTTYFNVHEAHYMPFMQAYSPIAAGTPGHAFQNFQGGWYYSLRGAYSLSQETSQSNIWTMLDRIGMDLGRGSGAAGRPPATAAVFAAVPPKYSEGQTFLDWQDRIGLSEYSENRHDYS